MTRINKFLKLFLERIIKGGRIIPEFDRIYKINGMESMSVKITKLIASLVFNFGYSRWKVQTWYTFNICLSIYFMGGAFEIESAKFSTCYVFDREVS